MRWKTNVCFIIIDSHLQSFQNNYSILPLIIIKVVILHRSQKINKLFMILIFQSQNLEPLHSGLVKYFPLSLWIEDNRFVLACYKTPINLYFFPKYLLSCRTNSNFKIAISCCSTTCSTCWSYFLLFYCKYWFTILGFCNYWFAILGFCNYWFKKFF